MLIANPIYDSAFKYLLEDLDIAAQLISLIIGEEVIHLDIRPQEMISKELFFEGIRLLRLDFKAIIRNKDGKEKKVLIELQKAKELFDIQRFRRYLGENYIKGDVVNEKEAVYKALPIITIYILGFKLSHVPYPVVKVGREFKDVLSGKVIKKPIDDEFLTLLTHESYTVQIPRLKKDVKTKLEKVLSVFNMEQEQINPRVLIADETDAREHPLLEKIVNRLGRAMLDENMHRTMEAEEEIERLFGKNLAKLKKVTKKVQKLEAQLDDTSKQLDDTSKQLDDTSKQLDDTSKQLDDTSKQLDDTSKQLDEERKSKEALLKELEILKSKKNNKR
jgi:ABC-type antimicrobial peptide transport system permease subunit